MFDYFINAFATLFVTIDPVGLAPMFLAVTSGLSAHDRRRVAIRATVTAAGILMLFFVAGQTVLNVLGISVSAFRVAGGILLFLIAIEMVFGKRAARKSETAEKAVEDNPPSDVHEVAIFPLAIPLIAGPAAISAIILLSGQAPDTLTYAGLGAVIVTILGLCLVAFLLADKLERLMGDTAQLVITRLLGVLLAALSIQFIADGVLVLASG
ncbi:MarC family protein [Labrenzia sp. CE80]|uniref:MarC family protein n=1 Tax=Labrenzia sp. CE80 TaxID=1788986 RepID=UPI00129BE3BD|nr:MarC family protein [Labrenzia sp. CE80]